MSARRMQPRHADPVSLLHSGDSATNGDNGANAFMAGNERWLWLYRPVPVGGVKSVWQTPEASILTKIWPGATSELEPRLL